MSYRTGGFHRVAHQLHDLFSWCPSAYLRAWGAVLRPLPDSALKQRVTNTFTSHSWPDIALAPRVISVAGQEITVVPYPHDITMQAHWSRTLRYEAGLNSWLASRQYDVIIEIGANVGIHTCALAKLFPHAAIHSFEPSQKVFAKLLTNLALNAADNVQAYCLAIADRAGFAAFFEPEGHNTNGSFVRAMASQFTDSVSETLVPTIGPDELASLIPAEQRVLIKLDIEAAEPMVLTSLRDLLSERRPDLVIEVLSSTADALNCIEYLRTVYCPHRIASDGSLVAVPHFSVEPEVWYEDNVLLPRCAS